MRDHRGEFPVEEMCKVLCVSKSGFYEYEKRGNSVRKERREELRPLIEKAYADSGARYGSPRVHRELRAQGVKVCENTIARLMKEYELKARHKKRFVPCTTDSNHDYPIVGNLLDGNFKAEEPNEKWTCDITYVRTEEGWLYVAAVMDLYSRKIVGWSMCEHLRVELVSNAMKMALERRQPGSGVMHHSDRGVQYACEEYRSLLKKHGLVCSMSRTGNCYDNAVMESFWSTMKLECVYRQAYQTRQAARQSMFEYIEMFYNRKRRHSSLGYISPEAFEAARN
jgi:transposase InsO family protein